MEKLVKIVLVLLLLLVATGVDAQKIDQRLTDLVEKTAVRRVKGMKPIDAQAVKKSIAVDFNADGSISSLSAIATLKKDAECPTEKLEQMGVEVRYVLGDMVALKIPANKLKDLENVEEFLFVKADQISRVMNEEARKDAGVEKVNTTAAATAESLPKAYTGEGVVLGVIDMGMDYNHAAFRNADGTSRIKMVIDYTSGQAIEYKTEAEIKALTTDDPSGTHGTHTSAIAGGSNVGNNQQGMAPQADLILCGLGQNPSQTNVIEAMTKIFDYAKSVGMPAVISISLGSVIGLHDGSDEYCKAVATLTENGNAKGRAVVMSSGNSASNWQSIVMPLYKNLTGPHQWQLETVLGASTCPTYDSMTDPVVYDADYYAYAADHDDFMMSLALVDINTGQVYNITDELLDKDGNILSKDDILKKYFVYSKDNERVSIYVMELSQTPVYIENAAYRLVLFADGSKDGQIIKVMCQGDNYVEPCFDAPVEDDYNFAAAGYTKGNGEMACNISICSDYVISVGSYITRNEWPVYTGGSDHYGVSRLTGKMQELGEISDFSSYCVDDNGIPRPTVIAPGQGLISACNNYSQEFFISGQPGVPNTEKSLNTLCYKVDKNNRTNWYVLEQGTSMSTPATAGIIALWMQANPNLTTNEIIGILKETCRNDQYTTNTSMIPSGNTVQAGLGKIDCLAGLKKITNATGIEMIEMDGDREATPATMYKVDAPVYNMMGQRVDKSQKGLVIYKGRKYLNK